MRTLIVLFALAAAGCYTEADVGSRASYATPDLEFVAPGVQVVAGFDYPVFFADGAYWRYDGGIWYRSHTYTGGWSVSYNVPVAVRRIDRPAAYAHYHAHARGTVRDHRQPVHARSVRDHRR